MKIKYFLLMLITSLSLIGGELAAQDSASAQKKDEPTKDLESPKVRRIIPAIPLMVRPGGVAAVSVDRPGEVKRALDLYQSQALRFLNSILRAQSDEERAELVSRAPAPSSMSMLLGQVVMDDPADESAFEALSILARYSDLDAVEKALDTLSELKATAAKKTSKVSGKVEPLSLLLQHHVSNPKLADLASQLPEGPKTDQFLMDAFNTTANAEVRGKIGVQLVSKIAKEHEDLAMAMLNSLAEDRYMGGVRIGARGKTVKDWAEGRLREITKLAVGKTMPEVFGEDLDGQKKSLADYRGKVLVLDVWTTWCGPCVAMIPHEREMVERLKDKPFALLSVSCDEEKSTLTEFLKNKEMPWDHWWVGREGEFTKSLNISFFPTIYVLDRDGVIRHKNIRGEELEKAVTGLLAD